MNDNRAIYSIVRDIRRPYQQYAVYVLKYLSLSFILPRLCGESFQDHIDIDRFSGLCGRGSLCPLRQTTRSRHASRARDPRSRLRAAARRRGSRKSTLWVSRITYFGQAVRHDPSRISILNMVGYAKHPLISRSTNWAR